MSMNLQHGDKPTLTRLRIAFLVFSFPFLLLLLVLGRPVAHQEKRKSDIVQHTVYGDRPMTAMTREEEELLGVA